jgi:hypothetical protein
MTPQRPLQRRLPLWFCLTATLLPALSGCISVDLPGLVSDTAKVGKEAYQALANKTAPQATQAPQAAPAPASPTAAASPSSSPNGTASAIAPAPAVAPAPAPAPAVQIFHTHVGLDTQPVAELQQRCVQEALDKATLAGLSGRPHRVADTSLVPVPPRVMAHCRLVFEARP